MGERIVSFIELAIVLIIYGFSLFEEKIILFRLWLIQKRFLDGSIDAIDFYDTSEELNQKFSSITDLNNYMSERIRELWEIVVR